MSPKCRYVNATSTQRLPACLQEALRALLARRNLAVSSLFFFNIADRLWVFGVFGGQHSKNSKVYVSMALGNKYHAEGYNPNDPAKQSSCTGKIGNGP